ncbi:MAG TPA: SRPBCC family protein [Gemmatimonadales bacterium]|nr:SRPBCC family protein [Gemmatimonadales bacterium]
MPWLIVVIGILLGLPLVAFAVGSMLPRDHVARMRITLPSPPERVWALISDFGGTPRWRSDVTRVEMLTAEGERVRFVETSKQGTVTFELVSQDPPRKQVVRVVDEGQPFGGTWTWEVEPEGSGARVTITEAGFIKNPLFRVMGKLFFPPTATMNAYLLALAKELGETATPVELPAP